MRDQLLGTDRGGRRYWLLTLDPARLWVQAAPPVPPGARDVGAMGVRDLKAEIVSLILPLPLTTTPNPNP